MTKFAELSIEALKPSDTNPRHQLRDIEELTESVKAVGLLQPIVVRKSGSAYTIIAGHRRAAAAAQAGLSKVPCVIRADAAKQDQVAHLVENTSRDDLMPGEIGVSVWDALQSKKIKGAQLAKTLGKSGAWVSKMKTIGEAAAKLAKDSGGDAPFVGIADPRLEGSVFLKERDSEKLYNKARAVLGLTDEENGEGDGADRDEGGEPTPELEVIKELHALALAALSEFGTHSTLDVVPVGKSGYEVRMAFRSESKFRQTFAVEKQGALPV